LAPDSSQTLKAPLAKITATRISLENISSPQSATNRLATCVPTGFSGYTGVRLSVAFCSFII
jgi:hypothetical protein